MKFHHFSADISGIELPEQFTFPFHYVPHLLSRLAAKDVETFLASHKEWADEINRGKMFGVLVVKSPDGEVGFLAAFSGNLAHSNNHEYFVPAVYDLLSPDGTFRQGEEIISAINHRIKAITDSDKMKFARADIATTKASAERAIADYRALMTQSKAARDTARARGADEHALIAESQFQKAELKRIKNAWAEKIAEAEKALNALHEEIEQLRAERKSRSNALQHWIFDQFNMLNARGENRTLTSIFADTPQGTPPAGAGECAAPKLLQYAFANGYHPVAMAEFWWGESPTDVIRHHGHFYGACKSKCEPILRFMLQGLDVEPNELASTPTGDLEVVYRDQWIMIVNKPAGMLSVPGKINTDSVLSRVQALCPEATGPMIVHRLDMATSGLIIIALDKSVHKTLQSMFKTRSIKKTYVALLSGTPSAQSGTIDLPICANPDDRPRQTVNAQYGKPAITTFTVTEIHDGITRVVFQPQTGRTHQLRVHSAHHLGLNAPIVGDRLYGHHAQRMYLHAESLQFEHPVTHAPIHVTAKAPF